MLERTPATDTDTATVAIPVHDHNAWWKVSLGFLVSHYFGMSSLYMGNFKGGEKEMERREKKNYTCMRFSMYKCTYKWFENTDFILIVRAVTMIRCVLKLVYSYLTWNLLQLAHKKSQHTHISHWVSNASFICRLFFHSHSLYWSCNKAHQKRTLLSSRYWKNNNKWNGENMR